MNDCGVTSDALTSQGLDLATSTSTQANAQAATNCINLARHITQCPKDVRGETLLNLYPWMSLSIRRRVAVALRSTF